MTEALVSSCSEPCPGCGAVLEGAGFIGSPHTTWTCDGLVAQQLPQVLVSKPTQLRGHAKRVIDWHRPIDLRQGHRRDHLGADPRRAGRGRHDQPLLCTNSQRQEGCFIRRPRPWCALQRTLRRWSEVSWVVTRLPRYRGLPASDLVRAVATDVDDEDLVVLLADPHLLADVVIWHRVLATLELNDRYAGAHVSRHAKCSRVRFSWEWVQTLAFLRQPF